MSNSNHRPHLAAQTHAATYSGAAIRRHRLLLLSVVGFVYLFLMTGQISASDVSVTTYGAQRLSLRLWVPNGSAPVRGVIVTCHPSGTEGASFQQDYRPSANSTTTWNESVNTNWNASNRADLALQLVAKRHNFALVGLWFSDQHPGGYGAGQVSTLPANAAALELGIAQVGNANGHPELATAPICTYGFSGGSGFAAYYAAYRPTRCIAFAHNKGQSIGDYDPAFLSAARVVPGLLTYGELDAPANIAAIMGVFTTQRGNGARWSLIPDYGLEHDSQGYGRYFAAAFLDRVIELRLPRDWVPGSLPVLRDLAEDSGWLGDNTTWNSGAASIVAWTDSSAPLTVKRSMSWLPSPGLAEAWRAITTQVPAARLSSPRSNSSAIRPAEIAFLPYGATRTLGMQPVGSTIAAVTWKDGDTVLGVDTSTPFSWTGASPDFGLQLLHGEAQLTAGGTSSSNLAIVLVDRSTTNATPLITTPATSASSTVITGVSVACSVRATDPDGNLEELLTYRWALVSGPATPSFASHNGTNAGKDMTAIFPTPGTYVLKATVTDANGATVVSSTASIVVQSVNPLSAPVITSQPTATTVAVGTSASFAVVATGNPAPSFQWRRNGQAIAGATAATYILATTMSTDSGSSFTCVVSNSQGSVTSSAAILTVTSIIPSSASGHWRFDELSGLTASDASGNGGTGSLIGMPAAWESGHISGALRFAGGAQRVQVPDSDALDLGTSFTLAAWIRPDSYGSYPGQGWGRIFFKGSAAGSRIDLCMTNGMLVFKANSTLYSSPNLIDLGVWQHISVTYDGSTLRMYHNGVLDSTQTVVFANAANSDPLYIGNTPNGDRAFVGLLDDMRVYKRPLAAGEIATLVNGNVVAPLITAQPLATSVTAGASATFSVVATGNPAPTYQWRRNGQVIAGATAATYTLATTTSADSGSSFTCVVSNSQGSITSSPAILTVTSIIPSSASGHWRFDEQSSLIANDASGNGGTGNLLGMPAAWESGQIGGALRFAGGAQRVQVPDSNALDIGTSFTLAAWIRPDSYGSYPGQGWGRIFFKGSAAGSRIDLCLNSGMLVFKANSSLSSSPNVISLGVWQHVAVTYDGTTLRMYHNGMLDSSHATTFANAANSDPLYIGNTPNGDRAFIGLLDDVRVYDRPLDATEIDALLDVSGPGQPSTSG